MKLTAADLDAAIYRDREPLRVVRMRNGSDERIVLTDSAALDDLPPLDLPQATEPEHRGAGFDHPPPRRSTWDEERESPWLIRLYAYAFLAVLLGSIIIGKCSS